ncbi:uncharacterized protein LOC129003421 [Macrosteles quadrilineatus]|uniref:uncharacterized protein LOC129003421 n=1 Tax=Macrosteles quadrilineatus TaxID=74068 RepID=UPI0023E1988E|nr:uncharacterized protein LOC129003421 [Macrosteles quadrilineatus]
MVLSARYAIHYTSETCGCLTYRCGNGVRSSSGKETGTTSHLNLKPIIGLNSGKATGTTNHLNLKPIIGLNSVCEDGVWRIRHNRELRELFQDPDIIGEVKSRRLRWVGHILRRKEESLLKTALRGNPRGRRPIGRPKARWWGQVRKDLERMRLVEEDAWDRDYWRQRVGEAKYQLGYKWPWQ